MLNLGHVLMRKSVHQIEIDAGDPSSAKRFYCTLHDGEGLHAANSLLNAVVEILDAQRNAIDARRRISLRLRRVDVARVELNGMMRERARIEAGADMFENALELCGIENVGCAAALVNFNHTPTTEHRPHEIEFKEQGGDIIEHWLSAARRKGVASAVPTELVAIRNVDVERNGVRRGKSGKPTRDDVIVHGR